MANLVRTAKGRLVDLNQLFMDNQKATALGNASMNARGDIVKHGKVVKTVEEQRQEYEEANERTSVTRTIPVSSNDKLDKILEKEVEELRPAPKSKKAPKPAPVVEPVQQVEEPKAVEPETNNQVEGLSLSDILG